MKKNIGLFLQRIGSVLVLLSIFLLIGAPGGGGHGGFGGGYHGGYSGAHGASGSRPMATVTNVVLLSLLFIAIVGGLICLIFYVQEKAYPNSSGLRTATTQLTLAVILGGNAADHSRFFDAVLKQSVFVNPQSRSAGLERVCAHWAASPLASGFVQISPFPSAGQVLRSALSLSKQQIQIVDGKRKGDLTGEPVCVAGFTITAAPGLIEKIQSSSNQEALERVWQILQRASTESLDAFYLFYSPAPGDTLPYSQAENMLDDLRTLGSGIV